MRRAPDRQREAACRADAIDGKEARMSTPSSAKVTVTDQAREVVLNTLDGLSAEQKTDYGMVRDKVRAELKRLIQKTTGRRPMIMPVILEI